jgi:hypothetical protein
VDSLPTERVWDYPAGEWGLIRKVTGYVRLPSGMASLSIPRFV